MTKDELINQIQEGMKTEESAVTIYSRHLSAIVSRSGLPEPDIAELKEFWIHSTQANKRHKQILTSLLKQVQGESIDVY